METARAASPTAPPRGASSSSGAPDPWEADASGALAPRPDEARPVGAGSWPDPPAMVLVVDLVRVLVNSDPILALVA